MARNNTRNEPLEWLICMPYIGSVCPICGVSFDTPDDIKACKFGHAPDVVHKHCWQAYIEKWPKDKPPKRAQQRRNT